MENVSQLKAGVNVSRTTNEFQITYLVLNKANIPLRLDSISAKDSFSVPRELRNSVCIPLPKGILPNFVVSLDGSEAKQLDVFYATNLFEQIEKSKLAIKIDIEGGSLLIYVDRKLVYGSLITFAIGARPTVSSYNRSVINLDSLRQEDILTTPKRQQKIKNMITETVVVKKPLRRPLLTKSPKKLIREAIKHSSKKKEFLKKWKSSQHHFIKLVSILESSMMKIANAAKAGNEEHVKHYQKLHSKASNLLCLLHCPMLGSVELMDHLEQQIKNWSMEYQRLTSDNPIDRDTFNQQETQIKTM